MDRSMYWPLKETTDEIKKIANSLNVCSKCGKEVPNGVKCWIDVKNDILYCPSCAVETGKWSAG